MFDIKKEIRKLATTNPELRVHLVPILKQAADESFEDAIKGKKFKNPETGNDVSFGSLPDDEQKSLREEWSKKNKEKDDGGSGDIDLQKYIDQPVLIGKIKEPAELKKIFNKASDPSGYKYSVVSAVLNNSDTPVDVLVSASKSKSVRDADVETLVSNASSTAEVLKNVFDRLESSNKDNATFLGRIVGHKNAPDDLVEKVSKMVAGVKKDKSWLKGLVDKAMKERGIEVKKPDGKPNKPSAGKKNELLGDHISGLPQKLRSAIKNQVSEALDDTDLDDKESVKKTIKKLEEEAPQMAWDAGVKDDEGQIHGAVENIVGNLKKHLRTLK